MGLPISEHEMKKVLISKDNKGRIELNKLNRKGYYNFIKYITEEEILTLKKQFKGYEIINKIKGV